MSDREDTHKEENLHYKYYWQKFTIKRKMWSTTNVKIINICCTLVKTSSWLFLFDIRFLSNWESWHNCTNILNMIFVDDYSNYIWSMHDYDNDMHITHKIIIFQIFFFVWILMSWFEYCCHDALSQFISCFLLTIF